MRKLINFLQNKQNTSRSAVIVRKRLDEIKLRMDYDESASKINIDNFQLALLNFICNYLNLNADQVNLTVNHQDKKAICNMTVAIPDEIMA